MDKKSERKWRLRQLKLRSSIFLRRNGLYVAALAFLAVFGIAAALMFSTGGDKPEPVAHSKDERLADAVKASNKPTASPSPTPKPTSAPNTEKPFFTPVPTATVPSAQPSMPPDFSPIPEKSFAPELSKLQPPVDGSVIRVFAMNSLIYSETLGQWMTHSGVDIAAKKGDPVHCVLKGTVDNVYTDDLLGVTVVIKHANGLISVYSSLKEEPPVKIGETVGERQVIGNIGDTALGECAEKSHLHFEIYYNDEAIDPQSVIVFNKE